MNHLTTRYPYQVSLPIPARYFFLPQHNGTLRSRIREVG
jgi:hypothetical protein